MVNEGTIRGSIRWAFNTKTWDPSEQEWLLVSSCIPLEEKDRIGKFVFKADAKASMAGCLMIRKLVHLATGEPYDKITISRDKDGRPYLKHKKLPIDFNVSHQGNYTVLAGEVDRNFIVGVDVMNFEHKTGPKLSEFFRLMNKSFTHDEWNTILACDTDEKQSAMFFRHWSLKESYVKALGVGICTDLLKISFKINTISLSVVKPCTDTIVHIDKVENTSWRFHEWQLDCDHCVSVALSSPCNEPVNISPVPFTLLSWLDLVKEATPLLPPDVNYCKLFLEKKENALQIV